MKKRSSGDDWFSGVHLNHDILYAGLVLFALCALATQIAAGQYAAGATAGVLGLIGLQDYLSWRKFRVRGGRLSSGTLNTIDFLGIAAGVFAIAGAGASHLTMCLFGCLGYILACWAFWWRLPHADKDAYRQVVRVWEAEPGARVGYIAGFVVAAVVLSIFLRLASIGVWESGSSEAWWWLSAALAVYFTLYTLIGPTLRLFRKPDAGDGGVTPTESPV